MTGYTIGTMQSFSLSNSFIKKLYSVRSDSEDDGDDLLGGSTDTKASQQKKVRKEIEKRRFFSYTYCRFWYVLRFDKAICCCCRARRRREDFLYKEAKSMLSEEIDLLEIIKKLRVFQFSVNSVLKPHQKDLVNFFQDYTLQGEDESKRRQQSVAQQENMDVILARGSTIKRETSLDQALLEDIDELDDPKKRRLFTSVAKIDAARSDIDKKIVEKITVPQVHQEGAHHLSALGYHQDMNQLLS